MGTMTTRRGSRRHEKAIVCHFSPCCCLYSCPTNGWLVVVRCLLFKFRQEEFLVSLSPCLVVYLLGSFLVARGVRMGACFTIVVFRGFLSRSHLVPSGASSLLLCFSRFFLWLCVSLVVRSRASFRLARTPKTTNLVTTKGHPKTVSTSTAMQPHTTKKQCKKTMMGPKIQRYQIFL